MLPIYIISLKKDVEKRKKIENKLNTLQIPFEFIDAIYGKNLAQDFLTQLKPTGTILENNAIPTLGEIGCALSHLKVYELMIQRKQDWACIFEDDVIIDERLKDFFNHFDSSKFNLDSSNLYLLGGQNGISSNILIAKSFFTFIQIGQQKFYKTIKSEKYIYRACCYLMSNELAQKLINLSKSNFIIADDWQYMVNSGFISNIYLANFVDHPKDLSVSNLEQERKERIQKQIKNHSFISRLFGLLKRRTTLYSKIFTTLIYRFRR